MSSVRLKGFTAFTIFCAILLVGVLVPTSPVSDWAAVLALMALTFVSENFGLQLPMAGSVSLSFAVAYAALLYAGPTAAVLTAIVGSTTIAEYREGKPLIRRLFNLGQLTLSVGLAGLVYEAAGGVALSSSQHVDFWSAAIVPVVFFSVNVLLVSCFVSLLTGHPIGVVLSRQGFVSHGFSLVVLALLGLVVASLLAAGSWLGMALLVLPFMAARRTFRVYAELNEAYTSTVRSLVTAIEAKDPYTRGHSERVAIYARALADALGLAKSDSDLIERAALLHDVGKIGIPLDTLTSPAHLSSEEVRLIRQHPDVGSRLVGDVEFLSDIVPVIRHHHERIDGAGYPDGLIGEDIPVLSRLLAVADAYDAMTSNRAYRLAMTRDAAIAELKRVSGRQLDKEMTEGFILLLGHQAFEVVQDA